MHANLVVKQVFIVALGFIAGHSGDVSAGDQVCDASSRTVTLDKALFAGNLNVALFRSPRGLRGGAGTVVIPAGTWPQSENITVRTCQRILGAASSQS